MNLKSRLSSGLLSTALIAVGFIPLAAQSYGPFGPAGVTHIERGDRVVLNQQVSTAAGSRIYIQNGSTKARRDVHESEPYCYFNLYRSAAVIKTAFSLAPDAFEISGTQTRFDFAHTASEPLQVARLGGYSQDNSERFLITRINFASSNQPELTGMHCGVWAVANERNHVSLGEIRNTLGDVVTLELADDPAN